MRLSLSLLFLLAVSVMVSASTTINVPSDQPTIGAAIAAATNGDTVLVGPGTYKENIFFMGKSITVTSTGGAAATIIDGQQLGTVVTINQGEGRGAILSGFTIQNGLASDGGGIYLGATSPTITNNIIQNNMACSEGAGIDAEFGSPLIRGNIIQNNTQQPGCGQNIGGGGIAAAGEGSPQIVGNIIRNNAWPGSSGSGAGISVFSSSPLIEDNTITGNMAVGGTGGGILVTFSINASVVQNVIAGNVASEGSGIYVAMPFMTNRSLYVNNTIVGGTGQQGSAVWVGGDQTAVFYNNVVYGLSGQDALSCNGTSAKVQFFNNDAFAPNGTGWQGSCQPGQNGNISADPEFVNFNQRNFQLPSGSPAIDTGDNAAPKLPKADFLRKARIVGASVDMGAYEFQGTAE